MYVKKELINDNNTHFPVTIIEKTGSWNLGIAEVSNSKRRKLGKPNKIHGNGMQTCYGKLGQECWLG